MKKLVVLIVLGFAAIQMHKELVNYFEDKMIYEELKDLDLSSYKTISIEDLIEELKKDGVLDEDFQL